MGPRPAHDLRPHIKPGSAKMRDRGLVFLLSLSLIIGTIGLIIGVACMLMLAQLVSDWSDLRPKINTAFDRFIELSDKVK